MEHVLAIDVGTQSARAALVDREGGVHDSPDPGRAARYDRLYAEFEAVHDLLNYRWPTWCR